MSEYVEYKGLWFTNENIAPEVKEIIVNNVQTKRRFRFWFGDTKTGKSWNYACDVTGYIGRSGGTVKVPLLLPNSRSIGGGELMSDSIIKIVETSTKKVLYQHPTFNQPLFSVEGWGVLMNRTIYTNCSSSKAAQRLTDFMNGKRMSP